MALTLTAGMTLQAQTNEFVIQTKKLGAEIQPTMGCSLRISTMPLMEDYMPS